mmetsp:Transcript_22982/g.56703  ORF Transcript_22982/g.56703 Transcript_22982/m.56703 type:complete len:209 (-) Transcript_22982:2529-3155(-)
MGRAARGEELRVDAREGLEQLRGETVEDEQPHSLVQEQQPSCAVDQRVVRLVERAELLGEPALGVEEPPLEHLPRQQILRHNRPHQRPVRLQVVQEVRVRCEKVLHLLSLARRRLLAHLARHWLPRRRLNDVYKRLSPILHQVFREAEHRHAEKIQVGPLEQRLHRLLPREHRALAQERRVGLRGAPPHVLPGRVVRDLPLRAQIRVL